MKHFFYFFLFCLHLMGDVHASQESLWVEDSDNSDFTFSIRNMGFLRVRGKFHDFKIQMTFDEKDLSKSSLEINVDAKSIDTGINKRDDHLRDEDFFHVEKYPYITFKSTDFQHVSGDKYKLLGEFSIKGHTHPVTFDLEYKGISKTSEGIEKLTFKYKGEVDRFDYGLDWTTPIPTANLLMGKSVKINCSVTLTHGEKTLDPK